MIVFWAFEVQIPYQKYRRPPLLVMTEIMGQMQAQTWNPTIDFIFKKDGLTVAVFPGLILLSLCLSFFRDFKIWHKHRALVKFIYSEKATNFFEIFTLLLSYLLPVESEVKISQNFVAFSKYMNSSCIWGGTSKY